ncbi:MAG: MarR family transcriptional regulator [Spirochaetales bacterium]|nr:MarR family transcriptional regulator [Spirochaetales bacterium]
MKSEWILPGSAFLQGLNQSDVRGKFGIEAETIEEMARSMAFVQEFSLGLERHFQRYGLSQAGFLILLLLFIDSKGEHTASNLAEQLAVRPPTMTGLIDTLEKQGFLKRKAVVADRRKYSIALTPKGKKNMEVILPDHFQRIQTAFGPLNDPPFRKQKAVVLQGLSQAMARLSGESV